jgi:hypothetical protein
MSIQNAANLLGVYLANIGITGTVEFDPDGSLVVHTRTNRRDMVPTYWCHYPVNVKDRSEAKS